MNNIVRKLGVMTILFCAASTSYADNSYRFAMNGLYSSTKSDTDIDETDVGIGGRYFFAPVSADHGPLKLAEFLSRQTNIGASITNVELEFGTAKLSGLLYSFQYQYAVPSQPYTFDIEYENGEAKDSPYKQTYEKLEVTLGYYMDVQRQVTANVYQSNTKISGAGFDAKPESNGIGIGYRDLMNMDNLHFIDLQLGALLTENEDNDSNLELSVFADYFVNLGMDFYGGLSLNEGDDNSSEGTKLNIGVGSFFNPMVSIRFELTEFMAKQSNNDSNTAEINLEARFK